MNGQPLGNTASVILPHIPVKTITGVLHLVNASVFYRRKDNKNIRPEYTKNVVQEKKNFRDNIRRRRAAGGRALKICPVGKFSEEPGCRGGSGFRRQALVL